jgi:hypothetical protein
MRSRIFAVLAIAVAMNAIVTGQGPMNAPTAPINFTSPAPVAPRTWPGSISSIPTTMPRNAESGEM